MPRAPDRWLNYSWYGNAVVDTFVAMKVPLATHFKVPAVEKFTPEIALSKLPLGLIIDLTNTTRYYNPNEFINGGVEHQKLFVKGHVVPETKTVESFITIVKGFLKNASSGGKLIGVHCTHGVNRTGYLVCAYLILEMGFHAEDAIKLFNTKRGHKMERQNYLAGLRSLNQQAPNGSVQPPQPHRDIGASGHSQPGGMKTMLNIMKKPNPPNQSRLGKKHHVERHRQPMDEQRDMRPQDSHHHYQHKDDRRDARLQGYHNTTDHHQHRDERRDTRPQRNYNTADHYRHKDERRDTRPQWNNNAVDQTRRQSKSSRMPIIGEWDPETRRITRFPSACHGRVPKPTIFD